MNGQWTPPLLKENMIEYITSFGGGHRIVCHSGHRKVYHPEAV